MSNPLVERFSSFTKIEQIRKRPTSMTVRSCSGWEAGREFQASGRLGRAWGPGAAVLASVPPPDRLLRSSFAHNPVDTCSLQWRKSKAEQLSSVHVRRGEHHREMQSSEGTWGREVGRWPSPPSTVGRGLSERSWVWMSEGGLGVHTSILQLLCGLTFSFVQGELRCSFSEKICFVVGSWGDKICLWYGAFPYFGIA